MNISEKTMKLKKQREKVMAKGIISSYPTYIQEAKGSKVWDVEGKEYLDFAGGIAVMNVGHSHPKVISAIKKQAEKFTHTCFMVVPYESAVILAEKLCSVIPGNSEKAAMFVNSGAEAVENAIKIARYYTKRQAVIAFDGAFHGRTLLAMSLTSKVKPYKLGFGPFAPEVYRMPYAYCYRCPFNLEYPKCGVYCADYLEKFLKSNVDGESVAALIVEPVQGEGGFIVPPPEYFPKLKKICENNGILFIADEIQSGMGRTGELFGISHWNIEADLTTVAKSLAAGLPLSAVVGKKEIMDSVHPGGIGGTYGGNPIACASALAVFDIIETENLIDRAKELGKTLQERFDELKEEFEIIGDARGIGAMTALELVKDRSTKTPAVEEAKSLVKYCYDMGLIILSCGIYGNVIRFLMPLNIPKGELEKGLGILHDGLQYISN